MFYEDIGRRLSFGLLNCCLRLFNHHFQSKNKYSPKLLDTPSRKSMEYFERVH